MDCNSAKASLIDQLKKAYSGELAAAYAYTGHAKSVRDALEMQEIETIREQEIEHRQRVGEMLAELGSGPAVPARRLNLVTHPSRPLVV
jgi:rubrerythrin